MEFSNFSIARDLLYVSGVLTGLTLGYVLILFRRGISIRSRNRRLTLIFCVFSGDLAAFSAAIVVSMGEIFFSGGLFLAAGLCVPVFALAVCFPRTVAYPLILAGGLLVVWLGYSFLRFPLIVEGGSPLMSIYREGDNVYSVRLSAGPGKTEVRAAKTAAPEVPAGDRAAAVFQTRGTQSPLDMEGILISFHPRYPLIGGTARGMITLIGRDGETLYTDLRSENSSLKGRYSRPGSFGITFQQIAGTVPLDAIPPGANLAVFFADGALSLQPSWQNGVFR
ncbi:MAG: hypothetical protein LBK02_10400 [Treponema sp.]|jgi:hypothetical protein|nr:hypothetical protein [Treponema sp.]